MVADSMDWLKDFGRGTLLVLRFLWDVHIACGAIKSSPMGFTKRVVGWCREGRGDKQGSRCGRSLIIDRRLGKYKQ